MAKFLNFLVIICSINCLSANILPGVIQLDTLSFNKTVDAFPYALVKFDKGYPTGDKHKIFGDLGRELHEVNHILVAEVRVKDYGDQENVALGEEFEVTKEQMPELFLFQRDQGKHTRYGGEFSIESIKSFLKIKTGVALPLPGCLAEFDALAEMFISAETNKKRFEILEQTDKRIREDGGKLKRRDLAQAKKYAKIMKMSYDNLEWIMTEVARNRKLMASKMSDHKRDEMGLSQPP